MKRALVLVGLVACDAVYSVNASPEPAGDAAVVAVEGGAEAVDAGTTTTDAGATSMDAGADGGAAEDGGNDGGSPVPKSAQVIFVSSQSYQGDLGGVSGADAKCQALATAAGLPGPFLAWVAVVGGASPLSRMTTHASWPYKLPNGTVVAQNWAGLLAPSALLSPINVTELGASVGAGTPVWMNTDASGTPQEADCGGWMIAVGPANGRLGWATATAIESPNIYMCNNSARLYCVQQ